MDRKMWKWDQKNQQFTEQAGKTMKCTPRTGW